MGSAGTKDTVGGAIYKTAGSAITKGDVVAVGTGFGVALDTVASGAIVPVAVEEAYWLTKKATLVISAGDEVYWDADPGEVTKTDADGVFIGIAARNAAAGDATVSVILRHPAITA